MIAKTYRVKNKIEFEKDLHKVMFNLKTPYIVKAFSYDKNKKEFVFTIEANDNFHNELSNLGYTSS
jgi:hypothetical protein